MFSIYTETESRQQGIDCNLPTYSVAEPSSHQIAVALDPNNEMLALDLQFEDFPVCQSQGKESAGDISIASPLSASGEKEVAVPKGAVADTRISAKRR